MQFRGQVVGRRSRSRKLAFFDVREEVQFGAVAPKSRLTEGKMVSVIADGANVTVVEAGAEILSPARVAPPGVTLFKFIRSGDEIAVEGNSVERDQKGVLVATTNIRADRIVVLRRWSKLGEGLFEPYRESRTPSKNTESESTTPEDGLCKFFVASGVCLRDSCPYYHESDARKRRLWELTRRRERCEASAFACDPYSVGQKRPKQHRAAVLADYMEKLFGEDLKKGVIDVAGGNGMLACEMISRGIRCLTVDPRQAQLSRASRRYYANKAASFDKQLWQIRDYFDSGFFSRHDEAAAFARDCCCIVGLHPDQATGAIVEVALAVGKPFVVVPCCVFGAEFPERTFAPSPMCPVDDCQGTTQSTATPPLRHVQSYEDLLHWVRQQTSVTGAFLPLEGKNVVLSSSK